MLLSLARASYVSIDSQENIYNIMQKLPYELGTALEDCRTSKPSAVALRLMRQRIYGVALREYPEKSVNYLIVEEWCLDTYTQSQSNVEVKVRAILPPGK